MLPFRKKKKPLFRVFFLTVIGIGALWGIVTPLRTYRGAVLPISHEVVYLQSLSKQSLIKKIQAQQSELERLLALQAENAVLVKENEMFKLEFDRSDSKKEGILARVITLPDKSLYDTMIVDAGEDQGVSVGQTVYAFGAVGLGTVSSVGKQQSTVLLFSAPGRETAATTTENTINVTLIGRGGGEYEIRMPRDVVFHEGDVVTEQTIHSAPLATVQKIVGDPRDPFQRLLAKMPLNIQNISWVFIR